MLAPVVDEVAVEVGETAIIGIVNINDHLPIAHQYNVKSVPALLFLKDGEVKARTGSIPKQEILNELNNL